MSIQQNNAPPQRKVLGGLKDVAASLELVVVYELSYCFISYMRRCRAATDSEMEGLKVENKHLKRDLLPQITQLSGHRETASKRI